MKKINLTLIIVLMLTLLGTSCKEKINVFTLEDDKKFGAQFDAEIRTNGQFSFLDKNTYSEAYTMINEYMQTLLKTGKVAHKDDFTWTVSIINDDATINAFAVPGGYLYFYTGLIRALENEAEFVGVLAHEMAHVARRHSTAQLTKAYGTELLLGLLLGNNSNQWVKIASEMAAGLTSLAFSRSDENEADKLAVDYTYVTDWDARGVADFFKNMHSDVHPKTPVFLSTHPSDDNRIERVKEEHKKLGGKQGQYFEENYERFILSLP